MLKKETEQRQAIEMLCTDMLVPQEHLVTEGIIYKNGIGREEVG